MNMFRLIHPLLLMLALLAGQLAYAAHSHHDEADNGDETCELCLQGAKLDSFQPAVPFAHAIPGAPGVRVPSCQTIYLPLSIRQQNPRAPPRT